MVRCTWCAELFVVCRGCDHGQQYCCKEHAQAGRRNSQKEAGRRYQRTPRGRRMNRNRQARHRARRGCGDGGRVHDERKNVTHQPSLGRGRQAMVLSCTATTSSSTGTDNGVTCAICGDMIQGNWLRPDFCRRRSAWYRKHGHDWARNAGRDRATSRGGGLAPGDYRPSPRHSS